LLETNIFDIAAHLPAAHSSYYWQPWAENAEYYEEKTRTKQGTERQKRASEIEQARRCGWPSSSAVRVCGLGLLSAGYVLPGIPSPGLHFLSNSQKI
jgi:hypothetical protein